LFGCGSAFLVCRCRRVVEPGPDGGSVVVGGRVVSGWDRSGGWGVPGAVGWGVAVRSVRLGWGVHGSAGVVAGAPAGRGSRRRHCRRGRRLAPPVRQR